MQSLSAITCRCRLHTTPCCIDRRKSWNLATKQNLPQRPRLSMQSSRTVPPRPMIMTRSSQTLSKRVWLPSKLKSNKQQIWNTPSRGVLRRCARNFRKLQQKNCQREEQFRRALKHESLKFDYEQVSEQASEGHFSQRVDVKTCQSSPESCGADRGFKRDQLLARDVSITGSDRSQGGPRHSDSRRICRASVWSWALPFFMWDMFFDAVPVFTLRGGLR